MNEEEETNLNSNMELLIWHCTSTPFSEVALFKFQYGATNIDGKMNGTLYKQAFKFQYGATNI